MMRIDFFHAIARLSVLLLAVLTAAGCGGGDDPSATSTAETTSDSKQAIESEMEQQMEGQQAGSATSGGHDAGSGSMAMMNRQESGDGDSMDEYEDGDDDEEMYGESYNAQYSQQYGQANRGGRNTVPTRPVDVLQWTDTQILEAVAEKDGKVLQAIEAKAAASPGDPAFAQLMAQVLQKSSGGTMDTMPGGSAVGGFGIPGLGSLFGGGERGSGLQPAASMPSIPNITPGSVPPGGAFFQLEKHNVIPDPVLGVDSLEMMIGEAMLTYVPQAAQATRGAAQNLQRGAPSGHDAVGGNASSVSGHGAASGHGGGSPSGQPQNGSFPGSGPGSGSMSEEDYEEDERDRYQNGRTTAQRPMGNLQDEELVRAVVHGLVINNSDPAWMTLKNIVSGTVLTPLPMPISTQIVLTEVFSTEKPNVAVASDLLTAATQAVAATLQRTNRPCGFWRLSRKIPLTTF